MLVTVKALYVICIYFIVTLNDAHGSQSAAQQAQLSCGESAAAKANAKFGAVHYAQKNVRTY